MSAAVFLLAGVFAWNVAMAMTLITLPLYAHSLGLSGIAIGTLVALPGAIQVPLRFVSGAVVHRWGERTLLVFTYTVMALAGPLFYIAQGFGLLLAAQLIANASRGMYWTAAQGYASQLPGSRNVWLGRHQAVYNSGQILGTIGAGVLIAVAGYNLTFLTVTGLGLVAVLFSLGLPTLAPVARPGGPGVFQHYRRYLRMPPMYFAILCSFLAAQSFSLMQSFYPILLQEVGLASTAIGTLVSLRSLGSIFAGLLLARFLTPERRVPVIVVCLAGSGLAVGLSPLLHGMVWFGLFLGSLGAASAAMDLYHQLIAADIGTRSGGGPASALAIGGIGWGTSHFVLAATFGALVDTIGLFNAFHVWGSLMLVTATLILPLHRLAFARSA